MTLREGIERNDKFQNSIHLSLDLNHMDKAEAYIPTRSSLEVMERYIDNIIGRRREYATILIGPYGKGKSHLLFVLLTLLRGTKECESAASFLLERIGKVKPNLAKKIKGIHKEKKRFLPVILTYVQEDLNQGFLLALHEALLREGLENLVPVTYFSEAISVIEEWRMEYPNAYHGLEQFLLEEGEDIEKLIRKLRQYEKESYKRFIQIYPKLTSGGHFQPMINMSAMAIYQSVNDTLCKEYGYSGMFLIFDEFSKYIENHQPETISGDMKILQEMCELANRSDEQQMHLTFVAHKSIKEYGAFLPAMVLNSFTGVEGRMTEIFFLTSVKNNYELISHAIKKKEGLYTAYWKEREGRAVFTEEYYYTAGFSSSFTREEFQRMIVEGCFPLTPLAAYFLLSISEKVAQNERTLFTFLSKDEPYSLVWVIQNRESKEESLIGMPEIYDYFSSIFRKDTSLTTIHNEWLKADFALGRTKDRIERRVIKTLALVRMLHMPEEISGTDTVLRLGAFLTEEEYQKAKEQLLQKQILCFRIKTAAYDFKQTIGVDLEEEIRKIEHVQFAEISVVETLQKYAEMNYEIPKQYNQNYTMTRFFQYQFIQERDFLELSKSNYLFEENFSDGKILLLITEERQEISEENRKERIQKKLKELDDSRMVVIWSQIPFQEKDLLCRISAIDYLLKEKEFLEQNQVIRQELFLSREDVLYELNQRLQKKYSPEQGNGILYVGTKRKEFESVKNIEYEEYRGISQIQYNRILSRILEEYYDKTPKINQELINRNYISPPIRKARNRIVEGLLKRADFSEFETGTSPEATIFRATLQHTGLLGGNEKLETAVLQITEQIEVFIMQAEKRKCCFSEIYDVLQGKRIGMRKGAIPIYMAYCFTKYQGMTVVYREEKEVDFNVETLDQINENSSIYFLCTEEGTAAQIEYKEKLKTLFLDYRSGKYKENDSNRGIIEAISRWMRSLPQYTLSFTKPVIELDAQQWQELYEFRRLFQRQNLNPWEVLFLKIPAICKVGEKEYLAVFEKIAFWKQVLDGYLRQVKRKTAGRIKHMFSCKETEDLSQGLKLWYQRQKGEAKQRLYHTATNHFLNYIQSIATHDEEEIVSKISKILMDIFIEDWNDDSLENLMKILEQVKNEVEVGWREEQTRQNACRLLLEDEGGKVVEKYYKKEKKDTNTYIFQNALMDLLEEIGEAVELEQKVAVLAEVLEKLIS